MNSSQFAEVMTPRNASRVVSPGSRATQRRARASAGPSAIASLMMGPWRVERTTIGTEGSPFTPITSCLSRMGSHVPSYSASLPAFTRSTYRSCTSVIRFVSPQAMRALWPITTPGEPGSVAPTTFSRPPSRWARYQVDGSRAPRCGSLASIGLPVEVRAPDTTQLLLAAGVETPKGDDTTLAASLATVAASCDALLRDGLRRGFRQGAGGVTADGSSPSGTINGQSSLHAGSSAAAASSPARATMRARRISSR